jgi:excisionase family DNA binding protein
MAKKKAVDTAQTMGPTSTANALGISDTHLRRLEASGKLRATRDAEGRRRFLEADVIAYRNQRQK